MFCPQHNLTTLTLTTLIHGATLSHVCFSTSSHSIHSSFLTLPHSHLLKHRLLSTAPLCLEADDDKESTWLSNSDLPLATAWSWCLLLFFPLGQMACGILVPRPGIKPTPLALESWHLNHWITREVLIAWSWASHVPSLRKKVFTSKCGS